MSHLSLFVCPLYMTRDQSSRPITLKKLKVETYWLMIHFIEEIEWLEIFFLKLLHGIYKDLYVNCISSHEFYCETAVSWKCTLNRCIVCFFSIFSDYCQCLENICFIGKRNASNIFTYFPRYKHEWCRDRNKLIELRRIHFCN